MEFNPPAPAPFLIVLLFIADALVGEAGKQTSAIIGVSTSTVSVNGNEKGWGSEWHNCDCDAYVLLFAWSISL